MAPSTITVLVSSFEGLSLPSTLSIPVAADVHINDFSDILSARLPLHASDLSISSRCRNIDPTSCLPISSLLCSDDEPFLSLSLGARLRGGKGGFGSQLRAAGGRMSSRKKGNNQGDTNGSNRNLDGRRLRTVADAKNLATYMVMKPEMERKERAERRKRLEGVIAAAEKQEEEMREGRRNLRVDAEWLEAKEEAETKAREAVLAALKEGLIGNEGLMYDRTGSESSSASPEADSDANAELLSSSSGDEDKDAAGSAQPAAKPTANAVTFYGWDEDEDLSESDEEQDAEDVAPLESYEGKGKARA